MALFDNLPPEDVVLVTSQKIAKELRHSEPQQRKPLDFKKISGIRKAAPELQKYIEEEDKYDDEVIVGGSTAAFTQIKKFRVPKDLDLSAKHLDREVQNIALILKKNYGASNVIIKPKFRVNMGGKELDVVQIAIKSKNGEPVDAVDIKHEVDTGFGFGTISVHKHPAIRIGNIYFEPMGYLIERKATSIKEKYVDKIKAGKLPRARVRKDINDFRVMAQSVPDFKRKNLKIYMNEFEKNLTAFDDIPEKDAPEEKIEAGFSLFGGFGNGTDPFGAGGFFGTRKTAKKSPLEAKGFRLW
jgi:hypothetical protein